LAERGVVPKVSQRRRKILRAISTLTSPLLIDDYLELINPLWSTRELRGKVEKIKRETDDTVTVLIRPGYDWEGHEPGQYVRIGFEIDGRHHWRAYSLTSDPQREDGLISITPKLVDEGVVTPYLVKQARPGCLVRLGEVEGTFTLPDELPDKLLFVTAGSGITPVMSMLRHLAHEGELKDAIHIHSARKAGGVVFGDELRKLEQREDGLELHLRETSKDGRVAPKDLEELAPDWKEREAFVCGPAEMLEAFEDHFEEAGLEDNLHMERFQPIIGGEGAGEGGPIKFLKSDVEAESDGSQPILVAGEEAGCELPFGCRMGVCHTCVGKLKSGKVRDLRSGELSGQEGEIVRTCVNAPEGPIEIEL
jgi:ferredoxin-NADP reductase